jgi:hypothetical protein
MPPFSEPLSGPHLRHEMLAALVLEVRPVNGRSGFESSASNVSMQSWSAAATAW